MSDDLYSFPRRLNNLERKLFQSGNSVDYRPVQILRQNEAAPTMRVLDALMTEARDRQMRGEWMERATSDRWLAPRVHCGLRLYRSEAADRGIWQWIALRYRWYVQWRWANDDDVVAEDRWWGQVHKQAFARLWWGAELFRDGSDYEPVEEAFVFQDLPNSYLHRPIVRSRSLALAIADRFSSSATASAAQVNGLARVLNLTTVGSPPEVETGYQTDDGEAYDDWVRSGPTIPADWGDTTTGPAARDTTPSSRAGGAAVVQRGWEYAGLS
jgi:Family of unknown function (DUF6339)